MNVLKWRETAAADTSAMTAVEGEIREFIRRDFASVRRPTEDEGEMVANNISSLLQRVSGSSVQEIDRLIGELQTVRDTLQNEGERVQREIIQYANLSQAAMRSTKIIAESLTNWKASARQ
jgi:ABC-type transporter Mla subunit MlaD